MQSGVPTIKNWLNPLWPWARGFSLGLILLLTPSPYDSQAKTAPVAVEPESPSSPPFALMQAAKTAYGQGQWQRAAQLWQQAATQFAAQEQRLNQAIALNNLSLVYQDLQQWSEADQAISQSLAIAQAVKSSSSHTAALSVLAQAWNTQGLLQMKLGQATAALEAWQQALAGYQKLGDREGVFRVEMNQTQALQALGQYRRALTQLLQLHQTLQGQPDSALKVANGLALGAGLRATGEWENAEQAVQQGLSLAEKLGLRTEQSQAQLELGNIAQAQGESTKALEWYAKAAEQAPTPQFKLEAQINQFRVFTVTNKIQSAQQLIAPIQAQIQSAPLSHASLNARLHFLENIALWRQKSVRSLPADFNLEQELQATVQLATRIQDRRAQSYALGMLGHLYEQQKQAKAVMVTQSALQLAEAIQADDLRYQWQWQLGRIYRQQGQPDAAIAAYDESVKTLQSLRKDLVILNRNLQFSFREGVEPVYREFVDVLLQRRDNQPTSQAHLIQARSVIEALQIAELDNFFQDACFDIQPKQIDQVDPAAAIIYPILLPDRLEIILSLPKAPLQQFTTPVSQEDMTKTLRVLRRSLSNPVVSSSKTSQEVYDWVLRPLEPALKQRSIRTLVFVPDGALRNIPFAALNDGHQYIFEKYGVAITSGLQLLDPKPLQAVKTKALIAGLSEARQGFQALPGVSRELLAVKSEVSGSILLNETFTLRNLEQRLSVQNFPILHLATHGQFSSDAKKNFLLTWDAQITINHLQELLQARRERGEPASLELLVLSACQTALGDDRATLGLAGMALRAGARSTLATLWSVNDEATAMVMTEFYKALSQPNTTKTEALRQAQAVLIKHPRFKAPYYWSPYVLIGNWL